ncbi:MAG: AAA family ATPase [Nitrospira bacterium SG8_3]|nr:MAG: AAA family ATPase [Nitrospira bacterium SG8_3]
MFKRPFYHVLLERLSEPRRFIQVLSGPRQTGKTTIAQQIMAGSEFPSHYASADEPFLKDQTWIEHQWEAARAKLKTKGPVKRALLILDEVQKVTGWSETVKRLWEEDTANRLPLYVIVLGSSPLLVQRGLTESLAGRFEVIPVTHWSLAEMEAAFGWDVEQYVFYGGYPGAADLVHDRQRWSNYIVHSLIETTVARDVLLMTRVDKPALLRRLFELGCSYSGQVLSYQKMIGQLQDAGNTTTLAHYLSLLEGSGLLVGLSKYAGARVRQRASSPKLQILNTALITAQSSLSMEEAKKDTDVWGRLVESAVGASLVNGIRGKGAQVFYWLSRTREVDFVLCRGHSLVAIEVKSGRRRVSLPGIQAFSKEFKVTRKLLVGAQGIPLQEFLLTPPEDWLD